MPNLYKQYFVHNEPDKTRVINSNDIVEKRLEKMAELKRMEQKQQTEMVSQQGSLVLTQIMWRRSTILQKQKKRLRRFSRSTCAGRNNFKSGRSGS